LSSLKKFDKDIENIGGMLISILKGIKPIEEIQENGFTRQLTEKSLRKVILVTLCQKQMNPNFNLLRIHSMILENQFGHSEQRFCEFHIEQALRPSKKGNTLKRLFSVMYLTNLV